MLGCWLEDRKMPFWCCSIPLVPGTYSLLGMRQSSQTAPASGWSLVPTWCMSLNANLPQSSILLSWPASVDGFRIAVAPVIVSFLPLLFSFLLNHSLPCDWITGEWKNMKRPLHPQHREFGAAPCIFTFSTCFHSADVHICRRHFFITLLSSVVITAVFDVKTSASLPSLSPPFIWHMYLYQSPDQEGCVSLLILGVWYQQKTISHHNKPELWSMVLLIALSF